MDQIPAEIQNELSKKYRNTVFIVSAQIFFVLVLTIAAFFLTNGNKRDEGVLTPIWILIIFIAIGSFVLRRVLSRWERYRNVKLVKGINGLLTTLQTNAIVLAAFGEIIAVIGFIAVMLGDDKIDMLRAAAVALVVLTINYPRKTIWTKIVANLKDI